MHYLDQLALRTQPFSVPAFFTSTDDDTSDRSLDDVLEDLDSSNLTH